MHLEEAFTRIQQLEAENQALRERLATLERRLLLDSSNSSKPPSGEGFLKAPRRTQSLRAQGQRRGGSQPGHRGQTLAMVESPDVIIEYRAPEQCGQCGVAGHQVPVATVLKRQVFDLPEPHLQVTEHQVIVKICPGCQQRVQSSFPATVKAPVQYGERLRGLALYFHHAHFIPEDRLSELLREVFGCTLTPVTLARLSTTASQALTPVVIELMDQLNDAPVQHLDETGCRLEGRTQWLHVVSSATTTWYRIHAQRQDLEPLQGLKGGVVHDHWCPYFQLVGVEHALCNAHHLRELKAVAERDGEPGAERGSQLLRLACRYHHRYPTGIPPCYQRRLKALYRHIVARGLAFHEALDPMPQSSQGRLKRRTG